MSERVWFAVAIAIGIPEDRIDFGGGLGFGTLRSAACQTKINTACADRLRPKIRTDSRTDSRLGQRPIVPFSEMSDRAIMDISISKEMGQHISRETSGEGKQKWVAQRFGRRFPLCKNAVPLLTVRHHPRSFSCLSHDPV